MTLASGRHIKLGSYEFDLVEELDAGSTYANLYRPHYRHAFESLFDQSSRGIVGMAGKNDVHPTRLVWAYDDWSGGEGVRNFQEDDPLVYDYSFGLNPRIRGQITSRPNRTYLGGTLTTDDISARPCLAVSQGALWYGGGYTAGYQSTDMSTWQVLTTSGTAAADMPSLRSKSTNYRITAMTGNSDYLFYSGWHNGSSGTRVLLAKKKDNTNIAGEVEAQATSKNAYAGLTIMNGRLYAWTGDKLFEFDIASTTGNTPTALASDKHRQVSPALANEISSANVFGTKWWANAVASENQVFTFYSSDGQSSVYQYSNKGGFGPLWTAPEGLTIKCMQYQNGVLYMAGHWGGDANSMGRGCLYAMSLDTLKPVFVGWFRKQNNLNLQMQEMCTSYGGQVIIAAAHTGRIFMYDTEMDSITMLDDIAVSGNGGGATEGSEPHVNPTDGLNFYGWQTGDVDNSGSHHRIGDMRTFGSARCVLIYKPSASANTSGNYQLLYYDDDEPGQRQKGTATNTYSATQISPSWDYGLPFEQKALMGFEVSFEPLVSGGSFVVEYSIDKAAFVTAGTINFAHADSQKGRTFIQISDGSTTIKFTSMRWRLTLIGTNAVYPPIILCVATEAQLITYDQVWELVVRLQNEVNGDKASNRRVQGSTLRDWILTQVALKSVLTFKDGYRYKVRGRFTTHTVTIEDPEDIIIRAGEGNMRIKLRTIPT